MNITIKYHDEVRRFAKVIRSHPMTPAALAERDRLLSAVAAGRRRPFSWP